jgi:uncharacterized protein YceK
MKQLIAFLLIVSGCATLKTSRTSSENHYQAVTPKPSESTSNDESGGRTAGVLILDGALAPQINGNGKNQQDFKGCNLYIKEITDLASDDGHEAVVRRDPTNGIAVVIYDKDTRKQRSTFGVVLFMKNQPQSYRQRCEIDGQFFYILKI